MTLMFLYVAFFFVTVTPNFVLQILEVNFGYTSDDYGKTYPLFLFRSTLLPLQGFFNVFIYLKPAYILDSMPPIQTNLCTLFFIRHYSIPRFHR